MPQEPLRCLGAPGPEWTQGAGTAASLPLRALPMPPKAKAGALALPAGELGGWVLKSRRGKVSIFLNVYRWCIFSPEMLPVKEII